MDRLKKNLPLLLLPLAGFLVYFPSLSKFFFQDDFFVLNIINIKSLSETIDFFKFRSDVIYYRPLSMQIYYFLMRTFFGLNPFPFHLFSLIIHTVNSLLIFKLVEILTKRRLLAFLVALLHTTSIVHFISHFWISTNSNIFVTFFYLLTFHLYLRRRYIFSITSFILALLSSEFAISLPIMLIVYEWVINKRRRLAVILRKLSSFLLAVFIYLFLRLIIFPIPVSGTYQLDFSPRIFKTLFWYLLWSLNLPEELKYQMINWWKINPLFINGFPSEFFWAVLSLVINGFLLIVIPLIFIFRYKIKTYQLFFLVWFFITLLPVIFLPSHQYPLYLGLPLVGFLTVVIRENLGRRLLAILVINWILSSLIWMRFSLLTHWAVSSAGVTKDYLGRTLEQFPSLPNGAKVVLSGGRRVELALMEQNALQVYYNDKSIISIYERIENSGFSCYERAVKQKISTTEECQKEHIYILRE